ATTRRAGTSPDAPASPWSGSRTRTASSATARPTTASGTSCWRPRPGGSGAAGAERDLGRLEALAGHVDALRPELLEGRLHVLVGVGLRSEEHTSELQSR